MIMPKMADGLTFDFACGDEVYGSCTELRGFLQDRGQADVLRCLPFRARARRRDGDDLRGGGEEAVGSVLGMAQSRGYRIPRPSWGNPQATVPVSARNR